MKKLTKGFTLIELLVVIAIIGILSSVVLASLNTARSKGTDAAIKANLGNARAEAEIFYDDNNDYDGVCATTGSNVIGDSSDAAIDAGSTNVDCTETTANDGWSISALLTSTSTFWCVDSTGFAGYVGAQVTDGSCN